jgi:hypothetical protein
MKALPLQQVLRRQTVWTHVIGLHHPIEGGCFGGGMPQDRAGRGPSGPRSAQQITVHSRHVRVIQMPPVTLPDLSVLNGP